ncbi:MAG: SUMF1/EgtB/PvdO family nonheme iron enzyme, partial [Deltaproteobacteria bacterium]|nr:SUMF1/EgtB/PvdO family nonheme iron enzyme [Deltaproteobacteria bacterium]
VILYEIATAQHPFGKFVPGDEASGQPKLVPVRHDRRPDGMPELNMRSALTYGKETSAEPPRFSDLLVGEQPPYLSELEGIAHRAMHPDPAQRLQSASELREAVLMSRARAERERLGVLRRQMRESTELTKASWRQFNVASKIDPAQWTSMHQLIGRLREMRESWHQGVEELVIRLKEVTKYENIPAARRMIAEISWERLIDGGDRMAEAVRQSLIRRIRENDVPVREEGTLTFGGLLDGEAGIALSFRDLEARAGISREASSTAQARIYSLNRERDAEGHEMGSYRRGELVQEGRWSDLQGNLRLSAGYYVMELEVPGYHSDPVPLHVRPQAVYNYLVDGQSMIVPVELVREGRLNSGLTLVQGGRSTTGYDFYQDGIPSNVYSFPTHEIELPTFAISRKPVTVGDYQEFIESMLAEGRIDEVRTYLPRKNTPPQRISRDLFRDTWRVYREEGLRAAFEHFLNRQRGYSYYWKVRPQGFGPWKQYRLTDPSSHADPNGDPILESQPISAITYHAAEAYAAWRSEREGRVYDLPTAEEKEKVDRNSFPWNFPWGYDFAPFHLISRLAFSGELKATTYPQPVGKHLMDQRYYRDQTLYGTVDNLGNVREFTSSQGEPEYVVLSGGSVRVPYGPFYYPASRNYAHRRNAVDDSVGAFRLVLRFGRPRPQDHSAEPPPVQE